ncbi:MAG TPA: hypothetical protein VFQ62_17350 [Methylomirabilota bacterium]|jgi:hypothetical protein|nr:hypothetical protein [Methylomirabilota bacterium]
MARTLHLLKGEEDDLAAATIARQLAAGDTVRVVALPGAHVPALPGGLAVPRAPDEISWAEVLAAMFEADQVIAW